MNERKKSILMGVLAGVLVPAFTSALFFAISFELLQLYGLVIFILAPLSSGFSSVFYCQKNEQKTFKECLIVSSVSSLSFLTLCLLLGLDGLMCIVMLSPIVLVNSTIGAIICYFMMKKLKYCVPARLNSSFLVLIPLTLFMEKQIELKPELNEVVTQIQIDAPREVVWKNVIAFPDLEPPTEFIFKLGIAYPKSANIIRTEDGSIRYCNFSTGPFVEPITKWEENALLAFDVVKNPDPMVETSIYNHFHPPHLDGFMESKKGQFKLIKISAKQTLLEGTTWYQHYLWPNFYWNIFSDKIIHMIHKRVLNHIKTISEKDNL